MELVIVVTRPPLLCDHMYQQLNIHFVFRFYNPFLSETWLEKPIQKHSRYIKNKKHVAVLVTVV